MKRLTFITVIIIIVFASCCKLNVSKETPECIDKSIRDFNRTSACDNAKVEEYSFQGKTVYVFDQGTCGADMTSGVFDSDCNNLGYLGGFTGNTKINGEEFSNAKFIKTTWKK